MLDPKRPLRLRMPDMRKVTLVGVTSTGDIVAEIHDKSGPLVFTFRPDGSMKHGDAFSTVLVQDTVDRSVFYPLDNTSGVVYEPKYRYPSLDVAAKIHDSAERFLEIAFEDDVPTGAKIHVQ